MSWIPGTEAQLLDAKDNRQRMLGSVPLADDERAAIDDGQAALDTLISRLADVPTLGGPMPKQRGLPSRGTLLPLVDIRQR